MVPLGPAWVPFAGQTVCALFIDLVAAQTLMCLAKSGAQTQIIIIIIIINLQAILFVTLAGVTTQTSVQQHE
jgi:hypothetical protein